MYVFPIVPVTLDFLEEINGGVRPKIESEPTYFVVDPGTHNSIISAKEFVELSEAKTGKFITMHYFA